MSYSQALVTHTLKLSPAIQKPTCIVLSGSTIYFGVSIQALTQTNIIYNNPKSKYKSTPSDQNAIPTHFPNLKKHPLISDCTPSLSPNRFSPPQTFKPVSLSSSLLSSTPLIPSLTLNTNTTGDQQPGSLELKLAPSL
eukprot:m.66618 g.66618  ORF g.66618 m.66618 type:complete len:138 (-) comp23710_c0_seq2:556-969(-)